MLIKALGSASTIALKRIAGFAIMVASIYRPSGQSQAVGGTSASWLKTVGRVIGILEIPRGDKAQCIHRHVGHGKLDLDLCDFAALIAEKYSPCGDISGDYVAVLEQLKYANERIGFKLSYNFDAQYVGIVEAHFVRPSWE